jgi:hypothetical protein
MSKRLVTAASFAAGAFLGVLPFVELLVVRTLASRRELVVVGLVGGGLALLLTVVTSRARGPWTCGAAAGFAGAWLVFGGDWRIPIYLVAVMPIGGPIAAGVALGVIVSLSRDTPSNANTAGHGSRP